MRNQPSKYFETAVLEILFGGTRTRGRSVLISLKAKVREEVAARRGMSGTAVVRGEDIF